MLPYREDNNKRSTCDIKIEFEAIKLDFLETIGSKVQPLIKVSIQQVTVDFASQEEKSNDSASYILAKLGIRQGRRYLDIKVSFDLDITYFNLRSLAFEPFIEPWSCEFVMRQLSP